MKRLRILLQSKLFLVSLIFISLFYSNFIINSSSSNIDNNNNSFIIKIIDYNFKNNKVIINGYCGEKVIVEYNINSLYNKEKVMNILEVGNYIDVSGKIVKHDSHEGFDYDDYLKKQNIFIYIKASNISLYKKNNNIFYFLKNLIIKRINRTGNNPYISSFIIGKNILDRNIKNIYKLNGVSHLFAISGMHVGFFSAFILRFLKKKNFNINLSYIITILILLFYAFLTGFSPSILRSLIMFILLYINNLIYYTEDNINILFISFSLHLFLVPVHLHLLGFWLSYIVTFFILLCINNFNFSNKIFSSICISSLSILSSIPLLINIEEGVNILSLFNNLICVPFVSFIVFPLSLFTFLFPFFNSLLSFSINILEFISLTLFKFRVVVKLNSLSYIYYFIYYILLIIFIKKRNKFILLIFVVYFLLFFL